MTTILERNDGDVSAVPVVWYIGHVPVSGSTEWDQVPAPEAGNRLTPRQYQTRWMAEYERQPIATPTVATSTTTPVETTVPVALPGGCTGGSVEALAGGWSLPGPRELIDANPAALDAPHHDYPAWDWLIPVNTPIYAVRGGTVVSIKSWPHNWWTSGCGQMGGGACSTCGVGLTIEDEQGVRWTYCHGTNVTVALNAVITAGTQIMWSGNTGRSGTPHVHLEIRVGGGWRGAPSGGWKIIGRRGRGDSGRVLSSPAARDWADIGSADAADPYPSPSSYMGLHLESVHLERDRLATVGYPPSRTLDVPRRSAAHCKATRS